MKHGCKECWDPVDREGEDLCDWCQMTPEQREARERRDWRLLALGVLLLVLAILLTGCNVDQQRALFQYCLQAAEPATSEAINACREAAWPEQRTKAPKEVV